MQTFTDVINNLLNDLKISQNSGANIRAIKTHKGLYKKKLATYNLASIQKYASKHNINIYMKNIYGKKVPIPKNKLIDKLANLKYKKPK